MTRLDDLTAPMRRTMAIMHTSEGWMTASEIGASAITLTLLSVRMDPLVERRKAVWGGEPGQKHGKGYEYRLTPKGREIKEGMPA